MYEKLDEMETFLTIFNKIDRAIYWYQFMIQMIYIIEGEGTLANETGEEALLKAGDFALVNPDEKHQYRNKGDKPFKMICGVPKEFEWSGGIHILLRKQPH